MCWVMPPASPAAHVGVPDGVEQLGLAVVDVAHHGHHRRPGLQIFLAALVLAELEVERLQQLAVLFLRGRRPERCSSSRRRAAAASRRPTDWVAVTISPRWNSTCTSEAGLTPILSAKSLSDAPRDSRMAWPLPRGICTPPIAGACMLSNSWRRCLRDLRPRDGRPPGRPNAPWVPLRPRPPHRRGRPPATTGAGPRHRRHRHRDAAHPCRDRHGRRHPGVPRRHRRRRDRRGQDRRDRHQGRHGRAAAACCSGWDGARRGGPCPPGWAVLARPGPAGPPDAGRRDAGCPGPGTRDRQRRARSGRAAAGAPRGAEPIPEATGAYGLLPGRGPGRGPPRPAGRGAPGRGAPWPWLPWPGPACPGRPVGLRSACPAPVPLCPGPAGPGRGAPGRGPGTGPRPGWAGRAGAPPSEGTGGTGARGAAGPARWDPRWRAGWPRPRVLPGWPRPGSPRPGRWPPARRGWPAGGH